MKSIQCLIGHITNLLVFRTDCNKSEIVRYLSNLSYAKLPVAHILHTWICILWQMMQQFSCSVRSFVRSFIHTYMASKVRNRHCVTICVHWHSPVRLHCIVFRVIWLGSGSFFFEFVHFFVSFFYWRWLHFDRSHMPFFGGLIFVSPGQLDYPADLSTHSHTHAYK